MTFGQRDLLSFAGKPGNTSVFSRPAFADNGSVFYVESVGFDETDTVKNGILSKFGTICQRSSNANHLQSVSVSIPLGRCDFFSVTID